MPDEIDIFITRLEDDEVQVTVPKEHTKALHKFLVDEAKLSVTAPKDFLTETTSYRRNKDGTVVPVVKVIDCIIYASDPEDRIDSIIKDWLGKS